MATRTTFDETPIWPKYSEQALEQATQENRLEELLNELAEEILTNREISDETKFKTACCAIYKIPSNQSALLAKISKPLKAAGLWKMASGYRSFSQSDPYHKILQDAQKQAVQQRNLPAALKLVKKTGYVDRFLIKIVLDYLPDRKLVERVVARDCSTNFSSLWFNKLSEGHKTLFFQGGYCLVDPNKKDYSKNSEILDLLIPYKEAQREHLAKATRALITPSDIVEDIAVILKGFSTISPDQLTECAEAAAILSFDGLKGDTKVSLVQAVAGLPTGRRTSLCEAASMLDLRSTKVRRLRKRSGPSDENFLPFYLSFP